MEHRRAANAEGLIRTQDVCSLPRPAPLIMNQGRMRKREKGRKGIFIDHATFPLDESFSSFSMTSRRGVCTKVLSNTIETNFQILSTKYAKFQPNIQIFEYSISCLVSYINHYFDTNKSKKDVFWAYECCSNVHDTEKIGWKRWKTMFFKEFFLIRCLLIPKIR